MKKLFVVLMLALSLPAFAQEKRPELTPAQKAEVVWTLSNALTALVVGAPVLLATVASGKQEELCGVLKGTYTPQGPDICPGGDWVRIIPYLKQDQ